MSRVSTAMRSFCSVALALALCIGICLPMGLSPVGEAWGEEEAAASSNTTFVQTVDGITVTAVAQPEAVLAGAEMVVMILGDDPEASAALENGGVEHEGFLALDISFFKDGQEIEPAEGMVAVSVEVAASVLPEGVDVDSLQMQHHLQDADGAVSIETVASAAEGSISVTEDAAVVAEFSVASFSTFTITWGGAFGATYFNVTVHFVNTNGEEIDAPASNVTIGNNQTLTFANYASSVSGLKYKEARYGSATGDLVTSVKGSQETRYSGVTTRYLTFSNGSSQVAQLERAPMGGTVSAHVYLVYETDSVTPPAPELEKSLTREKTVVANTNDDGTFNGTYDLNLTISGAIGSTTEKAKLDILLIVDKSGSMKNTMGSDDSTSWPNRRIDKVADAVELLTNSISSNSDNIDVRYSVVSFSGPTDWDTSGSNNNADVALNWTASESAVNEAVGSISPNGGTNYQAAVNRGKTQLTSARTDAQKVVIFLTDGLPTVRNGVTSCGEGDAEEVARNLNAAVEEIKGMSCNSFYAVGAGPRFSSSSDTGYQNMQLLCSNVGTATSATEPSITRVYTAISTEELNKAFTDMAAESTQILCDNIVVADELTSYVEMSTQTPESTVVPKKMVVAVDTNSDGTIDLGGTSSSLALDKTDANDPATLEAVFEGGQIKLLFPASYKLEAGWEYSVIATIEPTEAAYQLYRDNGCNYPHMADPNTGTYAGQAGIFSNTEATVTYRYNGETVTEEFPMPVIRLTPGTLVIEKTISGLEGDAKAFAAALAAINFDVTLNGTTTNVPLSNFEIDDTTGKFIYTINGLSPDTTFSVVEKGADTVADYTLEVTSAGVEGSVAANETKTATFANKYEIAVTDLVVSKTVSGNLGDQSKAFEFTATLSGGALVDGNVEATKESVAYTVSNNGTTITFSLAHGQQVVIKGVPMTATIKIDEAEDGYTAYINGLETAAANGLFEATVVKNIPSATVAYENVKTIEVDTGLSLNSIPYALALGVVLLGGIFLVRRAIMRVEED